LPKLNLGSGAIEMADWINIDRKTGGEVYPLKAFPAGYVDEIRASHVLEHISHRLTGDVLADWVRALKPGGLLRIAVPDLEVISRQYLAGAEIPIQGYIMGGHVDDDDHHQAVFDDEALGDALRAAGLVGISHWTSELDDAASLPISLNLQGYKPLEAFPPVAAVMSLPRLAFTDNFFCAFEAFARLGISLRKFTGAFWGQCLTRAIEETLAAREFKYLLAVDYDSLYTMNDVQALISAAERHPEADAIAPLQASRSKGGPLMTIRGEDGINQAQIERDYFLPELSPVTTAHFGLTLIRVAALRDVLPPWFLGTPDPDGRWSDARCDEDIHFWRQWEKAGKTLYLANRVPIGHAELMIRWPDRNLEVTYQHPSDFWKTGKPGNIWR